MKPFAAPLLWLALALTASPQTLPLRGFHPESARAEEGWEARFRAIPDPANLRAYVERLSARPHHVGSPYDKDNAEWILSKFRSWGLEATIETFDVLFPTPWERTLEMVEPTRFTARLREPALAVDPTSSQQAEQLPGYNAYSIDGDVTAPLIYVNYGVPEDYETLQRLGVSVKGAIVIARYGASWRGIKPKVAAEHGAVGCLIYSDPRDDGYFGGVSFPAGPFRPADGVQRGSVMDMPVYPGDPLTPGIGATRDAKRLSLAEATTLTKIPVLPISYGDAQPLLAALGGPVAPEPWRGALPLTYRIGPGPAKVHLKLKFHWDSKPVHDVIARIPGAEYPDQWVIRGNHHDAWVNGAEDPSSGAAAVLEEARALGALVAQGWKPKRTILLCLWDGEEPGLLGSTEWAETHAAELARSAVAYVNSDSNGRGYLSVSGSHTLESFINGVARDVEDPETKRSAWQRVKARDLAGAPDAAARNAARTRPDFRIGALGSGSDYTVFVDHLGIPALNIGYEGEDDGGIYHSIYDDFYWYTHFSDSDFVYGRALAQTGGQAVMRLASADLLPFEFGAFAETVGRYVGEVERLARDRREAALERNRQLDAGVFEEIRDPRKPEAAPPRQTVPPFLNFAPLDNGLADLQAAAAAYSDAYARAFEKPRAAAALRDANARLMAFERSLLLPDGLPGRPWFRNQVYAPGFYTGYGVKTLPGVRESIEQGHWDVAGEQIGRAGGVLKAAAAALRAAASAL